ncbi:DUF1127 domain-containing protein [Rhizobium sp. CG5]|uniref:DUF1127 domain-containing protein n=1 Tax=Rhizobium sp. CG5 TaxID=2726076 RepID=UPI0020344C1C|nr:DUF1127 domain-containing protein [Rhizobium sp. CG5]MCM2472925.1 DUF1127 domain-containing protein [Rhizobium sp. CG5]
MRTTERMIELDRPASSTAVTTRLAGLWISVKSVWRAVRNRHVANRLADLDDYLLDDIGLTRSDIDRILGDTGLVDDPSQQLTWAALKRARYMLIGASRV